MQASPFSPSGLPGADRLIAGRYRLEQALSSVPPYVWVAWDTLAARRCLLKCLSAEGEAEFAQRLERHAHMLSHLRHAGIPALWDRFSEDGHACLVLEYVEAESLGSLLKRGKHFTEAEALRMLRKLAAILAYLQSFSPPLIHRNLTPANILLGKQGEVYLTDFGLVKGHMADTPLPRAALEAAYGYLPLEAFDNRAGPASDIYSLGACLIHALSHIEPAGLGRVGEALNFRPYVNLSDGFVRVLARMTAPNPEDRYAGAVQLLAELESMRRPRQKRLHLVLIAALLLAFPVIYLLAPPPVPNPAPPAPATPLPDTSPEIGTEKQVYAPDEPITVIYSGLPGKARDGISLVSAGAEEDDYGLWAYTSGKQAGRQTFEARLPGEYEARVYFENSGGEYRLQGRFPFRVAGGSPARPVQPPAGESAQSEAPLNVLDLPLIMPQAPAAGPPVTGRVLFDSQPLIRLTPRIPKFWFRNEAENRVEEPRVDYRDSGFEIHGLPAGRFGMQTSLDLNTDNPVFYPGDLYAWTMFKTEAGEAVEVVMRQVIHLTSPQDNGQILEGWGAACMDKPAFASPVRLAWDSLGENVEYEVRIERMDCANHYNSVGAPLLDITLNRQTSLLAELPPSRDQEVYGLHLHAKRQGSAIGTLMTHGNNGMGWDYRFRVK